LCLCKRPRRYSRSLWSTPEFRVEGWLGPTWPTLLMVTVGTVLFWRVSGVSVSRSWYPAFKASPSSLLYWPTLLESPLANSCCRAGSNLVSCFTGCSPGICPGKLELTTWNVVGTARSHDDQEFSELRCEWSMPLLSFLTEADVEGNT